MVRISIAAQILWRTVLVVALAVAGALLLTAALPELPWWVRAFTVLAAAAALLFVVLARWWSGVARLLRALHTSVDGLSDGDFSFSLRNPRRDELGELVRLHNRLATVLREERAHLKQRELLLDTVISTSPLSLLLVGPGGHIVMGNLEARRLLGGGRPLEGLQAEALLEHYSPKLSAAVQRGSDGLVTTPVEGVEEAFHVSVHEFNFNARKHRLLILKRLTREINRQELETWKKVIRVISHELNNSMAPIKSLAHSGLKRAEKGGDAHLEKVFGVIEERAQHLLTFLQNYVTLARLPPPKPERIEWLRLLEPIAAAWPCHLEIEAASPGWADPALLEQALINLLKNAHESDSPSEAIAVNVREERGGHEITVSDRGSGIPPEVLERAVVAFYSTKQQGSGVGLPLVRDIVEAHDGRFDIASRPGGGTTARLWLPLPASKRVPQKSDSAP